MEHDVKKELMKTLEQCVALLNEITVTDIRDCRRKVFVCDGILRVRKVLNALEFTENKEGGNDNTQASDR